MGRKSVKKDKNIYQLKREECGFTREEAAEALFFSSDTIERIERTNKNKQIPRPDFVLAMSELYKEPALCNYYCVNECAIGKKYMPELQYKNLSQIVLELSNLTRSIAEKQSLLEEIAFNDNKVTDDEIKTFVEVQNSFNRMSILARSLQLWSEEMIAEGKISKEKYNDALRQINNK